VAVAAPRRADEILELASRLFYEQGYQGVGMRTLAKEAGIQGGSLYHHFPSKEEMLYRITEYGSREFFAGLLPHLRSRGPYADRLDGFVRTFVVSSWERRHSIAVLFRDMSHLAPEHLDELRTVRRRFQQTFQRFVGAGVAAGEFFVPDPKVAGIAVLDLLLGIDHWMRESGRLDVRQVADTYAVLVAQMLGAGRRAPK
jgi:AcrR family transcriptional regulator